MNPVALVTGASGDIGRAIASRLAADGYDLCLHYSSDEDNAKTLANHITSMGRKAHIVQANFVEKSSVDKLFSSLDQHFGSLNLLVNNAALSNGRKSIEAINIDEAVNTYQVNCIVPLICSQQAAIRMKKSNGGSIVNISSQAGQFGGNQIALYASTKGALNTLTLAMAREFAPYNIRVNAVSPGLIDTSMHGTLTEQQKQDMAKTIPLGRVGSSEDVANAVSWLASNDSNYITGAILPIHGGR